MKYLESQPSLLCDDPVPKRRRKGCAGKNCPNPAIKKGYCEGHYKRFRLGKPMDNPLDPRRHNGAQARQCLVVGCQTKPVEARSGYCWSHAYRAKRGLPMDRPVRTNTKVTVEVIRSLAKDRQGECLDPENYRNPDTQLRWKCAADHEWAAPWNGVKYGGSWCPICVGRGGRAESMCRRVIELMFKSTFVLAHPEWLRSPVTGRTLELDGYNQELGIAFEYQGVQHYEAIGYFEKDQVERTRERDRIKAGICWDHGVSLIVVPAFHDLNDVEGVLRQIETAVTRAGLKEHRAWKRRRPTDINQIWEPADGPIPILSGIRMVMEQRGWERLSDYVDSNSKILWRCDAGHSWAALWSQIRNRPDCPACRAQKRRADRAAMTCQAIFSDGSACAAKAESKGYCHAHKIRLRRSQDMAAPIKRQARQISRICTAPNCDKPAHSHNLCSGHYHRWRKHLPLDPPIKPYPPNRGRTIDDASALAASKGGLCLSTSMSRAGDHLEWQCAEGHRWSATYGQVSGNKHKPGGTWCGQCHHLSKRNTPGQICSHPECAELARWTGLCQYHYNQRKYKQRHPQPFVSRNSGECRVDGCCRTKQSSGLCGLHYSRHRTGKPLIQRKDTKNPDFPDFEKF
jgi:hypothetical protein